MPKAPPPYPPEFREEAVRLFRTSGKSIGSLAADLGVAYETLRKWIKQHDVNDGNASGVTDAILERVFERQDRPRGVSYLIVLLDVLRGMIPDGGLVRDEAAYLALDIQADGAKFWFRMMNEPRVRGVNCATYRLLPH